MRTLRAWLLRVGGLFDRQRRDRELTEELESNLQLHIDENVRAGMSPEEARHHALIKLGGVEQVKESYRERRGLPWLERFAQDVRFGLRMLRKNPGFTAVAVLTLALGIGATTAIFTAAYATLLAPLPYSHPDRLVDIWSKLRGNHQWVSAADFLDWRRQSSAFEDLNAWSPSDFTLGMPDHSEYVEGFQATPGYYAMLGSPLFLGRSFLPEEGDPGRDHVVMLTYRLWRHLGASLNVIGQTIRLNGEPYRIVGVFAPGVADRRQWELVVPLSFTPKEREDRNDRYFSVTGRLKPGVTIDQAQQQLDAITTATAKEYPETNQGWGALVTPLKSDLVAGNTQLTVWMLLGAVMLLLLIACLNVANLLLAKGIGRQREVALRSALGAMRSVIFRQFLVESLLLATSGGLLGIAFGYSMLRVFVASIPPNTLPAEADLHLSIPVLLAMFGATTLAGPVFGCAPAWYASQLSPAEVLKDGRRSSMGVQHHRLRRALVIAEFALTLPLLAGAGLMIRSLWNLTHVDLGLRTDHLVAAYLNAPYLMKSTTKQADINSYYRRVLGGIGSLPGVVDVSAVSYLPLEGNLYASTDFGITGDPEYKNPSARPKADLEMVTPDYFKTFGIRIVRGRGFTDADDESSARVVMVNEVFVSRFLPSVDPIQQRLTMNRVNPNAPDGPAVDWQIVGVFHTVKSRGGRADNPEIDTPFWQEAYPISGIAVRTEEEPTAMIKTIAGAVNAVDSQAALYKPRTMNQVHDESLANDRFSLILFANFAGLGLLLAAVGIHGVMAFSIAQRSHEIAVRLSLGALPRDIRRMVLVEGATLTSLGIVVGAAAALALTRLMTSLLYGLEPWDASALLAVAALLGAVSMFAAYLPARRAMRIDPMVVLRHE
jgi:putative ABC transport system permease protein